MNWRRHLLLFVVLVPVFNTLAVLALPWLVNAVVTQRIIRQALTDAAIPSDDPGIQAHQQLVLERGAINVTLPARRADASARTVVRPSPDLLYTACVFDLDDGPVRISAPLPDGYLSVSGFSDDTSNFFAVNDRSGATGSDPSRIELRIVGDAVASDDTSVRTIRAPSRRGLVLFRMLIEDRAPDAALMALRAGQRCDPER